MNTAICQYATAVVVAVAVVGEQGVVITMVLSLTQHWVYDIPNLWALMNRRWNCLVERMRTSAVAAVAAVTFWMEWKSRKK